jgi:hypothetical protein
MYFTPKYDGVDVHGFDKPGCDAPGASRSCCCSVSYLDIIIIILIVLIDFMLLLCVTRQVSKEQVDDSNVGTVLSPVLIVQKQP